MATGARCAAVDTPDYRSSFGRTVHLFCNHHYVGIVMDKSIENAIKIAVVEEQVRGVREQQAAHAKDTRERFDLTNNKIDNMDGKIDELLASLNKGKGAYAMLVIMSGLVGAVVIKVAGAVIHWIKP